MKAVRYIALARQAGADSGGHWQHLKSLVSGIEGFHLAVDTDLLHVATSQDRPLRTGDQGVILGRLFEREERAVGQLEPDAANCLASEIVQRLCEAYWGHYVCLVQHPDGEGISVFRAPLGALPCFMVGFAGGLAIASDVDLLIACGLFRPAIDWDEVLRHLMVRDLVWPETCLSGLRELRGGQKLSLSRSGQDIEDVWSPAVFAKRDKLIRDPDTAARTVRETVCSSVASLASGEAGILLMLSGGLDSSLLASALTRQDVPVTCITFVTGDATGDERRYARQVCSALGLPLVEGWRNLAGIDVSRSDASELPRPTERMFFQESRRLCEEAAADAGATAIFNGGGGDNIFCSLRSGAPAADRLLTGGTGFLSTVRNLSRLTEESSPAVMADAVRRAWFGKPALRILHDPSLLSPDAVDAAHSRSQHPWLQHADQLLPGSAQHLRLLACAQDIVEGGRLSDRLPMGSPLLSQPLAEACLSMASWLWFDAGHNRAVARHGFADVLPAEVIWRRSKGTPDAFTARIFDANRLKLREILSQGELVRRGLVDLPAILAVIKDRRPVHGHAFRRVLQLADVEAWAADWIAIGHRQPGIPLTQAG